MVRSAFGWRGVDRDARDRLVIHHASACIVVGVADDSAFFHDRVVESWQDPAARADDQRTGPRRHDGCCRDDITNRASDTGRTPAGLEAGDNGPAGH